ncbi:TlpA family protein disulfide reductase [Psychroserpens sp.]|uniref:TlpA family protein disulfide reductase n=1 Tax=Psychroserpens sp. TaxID=2020870 RepID=UPI00385DAC8C
MTTPKTSKIFNFILVISIATLIIPQTRLPIQVFFNSLITKVVEPSVIKEAERTLISDYNWNLKDLKGQSLNFNSLKNKVVVINFWATWCPPCIAEMPSMEALYQSYKNNDDIVFLFVSSEDTEKLSEFMEEKNYSFPVYQPVSNYPSELNVSSIPRTFVIDKSGAITIDKSGAANWNSEIVTNTIDDLLRVF